MAFDQSRFAPVSAHASDSPSMYSYSTQDDLEDVLAVGYFDDKKHQLEAGDFIQIYAPQGFVLSQVLSDTSTVDVAANAIIQLDAQASALSDFDSPDWDRSHGIFQFKDVGSAFTNAPFEITQPTEDYEVIIKTDHGADIVKQLMTSKDPNGITKRFYRAGSPGSFVVTGGWSQIAGGLSNKGVATTTDATPTTIFTYPTETGKTYSVEFFVTGSSPISGGAFGGKYFMLLQNIGGTLVLVAGLETIYRKRSTGGIGATVAVATDEATIIIVGKTAQTWNWAVSLNTFEVVG